MKSCCVSQVPRKLLLQVHALAHYNSVHSSESPVDPGVFSFVAAYESPVLALQRDLETIGPRVGEVRNEAGFRETSLELL